MNQWHETTFKVIRSSWGINVHLRAGALPRNEWHGSVLDIHGAFSLAEVAITRGLLPEELTTLVSGFKMAAEDCDLKEHHSPIVVVLDELTYYETDFQIEGLMAVAYQWMVEFYQLVPRRLETEFDRSANRYTLKWIKSETI